MLTLGRFPSHSAHTSPPRRFPSAGEKRKGRKKRNKNEDAKLDGEVNRVKFVSNAKGKDVGKDFLTES